MGSPFPPVYFSLIFQNLPVMPLLCSLSQPLLLASIKLTEDAK